jgi:Undecaprenyl-phosphate glucose phosphotransferase
MRPDDIILLAGQADWRTLTELTSSLSELPANLHIVPVDLGELPTVARIATFDNLLTIQVQRLPLTLFDRIIKRAFDILVATVGLIVLSPMFLIVSMAIKLDSLGPVFFRQTRHGFNNEMIRVIKFRSMTCVEDGDDFTQAVRNDPRVTRVGSILRRTNIDELPQLINVLFGEMSIVGPRPHAPAQNRFFQTQITPFSRRHNVKPGITGWAQVNGHRGETDTLHKMQRRVDYDLQYIDNWSFWFDIKIVLMTFFSRAAFNNAY